jgi:hypothetical protein
VPVKHLVATSAASAVLALGLAPAAFAASSSSVVVQPGKVAPGGQVSVFGLDCTASTGTATSAAFSAPIPLSMLSNATGGVGTVSNKARPGTWRVTVTCGGKRYTGWVSVCPCGVKPTSSSGRPVGGAATGDGASQASAASGTGGLGSGTVLTAAGLGVVAVVVRRRRRSGNQG